MSTEKERETQVYMAKLAEQAERYEGFLSCYFPPFFISLIDLDLSIWGIDELMRFDESSCCFCG